MSRKNSLDQVVSFLEQAKKQSLFVYVIVRGEQAHFAVKVNDWELATPGFGNKKLLIHLNTSNAYGREATGRDWLPMPADTIPSALVVGSDVTVRPVVKDNANHLFFDIEGFGEVNLYHKLSKEQ